MFESEEVAKGREMKISLEKPEITVYKLSLSAQSLSRGA